MAGRTTERIVTQSRRRPVLLPLTARFVAVEVALLLLGLAVLSGRMVFIIVAAVLLVLVLVWVIPIAGRSLGQRLAARIRFSQRSPRQVNPADVPADLVPLAEWIPGLSVSLTTTGRGEEVGVITDGNAWTAVLALASDENLIADKGEQLNLTAMEGLTTQDDVVFAGVQVVTYTVPAPTVLLLGGETEASQSYRQITKHPPPTVRRTWLCVRLDPRLCLGAVARRGAGKDGIYATLRFGLHRVQSVLKRQGIATTVLDPLGIYDVMALTAGSGPEEHGTQRTSEDWTHWTCDGLVHSGRLIRRWGTSPSAGYGQVLDAVASAPVLFSITSYTFAPGRAASGGVRLVTPDVTTAQHAQQYVLDHLGGALTLAPAGGTQIPTVLATVPLGRGFAA
ncbi:type VII secretion protein EccE [Propionibacteriaceae bacterium Y2011]|uniref:type VII secretion protein EccE n=1 Tax=Microlunatus sp. Y2014 TaxID=3418488 RepID=UPI003B4E8410